MMECKKALAGAGGDIDAAIEELRKSSGMKAAKKVARTAAEGAIALQLADDGKSGAMVEVNSETDFAARAANFLGFVGSVFAEVAGQQPTDLAQQMPAGFD